MGKSIPYVFLALSIAFFLFLVGLTGYRIETVRRATVADTTTRSAELLAKAKALRDVNGSFDSPYFVSKMRDGFSTEPRLLVLSLYTPDDGIVYLIARNKSYLSQPADALTGWKGKPAYRFSSGFETLYSLSFPLATPEGEKTVLMDSLFVIFGREDLYPILRDDLYLLLSFLIVCGIFILIAANVQDVGKERSARGGGGAAADAPARTPAPAPVPPAESEPGMPPTAAAYRHPASEELPAPAEINAPSESGLVRQEYFAPRLKSEIDRAASADEDIAVACIQIDGQAADRLTNTCAKAIACMLKEVFPLQDLVFETGKGAFAVILPDSDIDQSVKSLEDLRARIAREHIEGKSLTVSIGVSARGGRLIEDTTLLREADVSVQKARREGGNAVMGFRASPSKYRQALSGLGS
jgi:diguanylate cyclase (GGDEF)-like protein